MVMVGGRVVVVRVLQGGKHRAGGRRVVQNLIRAGEFLAGHWRKCKIGLLHYRSRLDDRRLHAVGRQGNGAKDIEGDPVVNE